MNIYTYDENTVEELRNKYFIRKPIVADFSRLHNMLWLWLSEHPGKIKENWPLWLENDGWVDDRKITYGCFACAVVPWVSDILLCPKCPLDWPGKNKDCIGSVETLGQHSSWRQAIANKDFKEASRLASVIAGLSWSGQKEFIIQKNKEITAYKPANRAVPRTLENKG